MNACLVLGHYLAARRRFAAFDDRAALESWQSGKIRRHLLDISRRSPFYRAWFADPKNGSPSNFSSWPRVDKPTVAHHLDRWLTEKNDLSAAREMATDAMTTRRFARTLPGNVTVGLSSGTTGPAAMFFVSARERAAWAGLALARVLRKLSWRQPQRIAFFLRANSSLYETVGSRTVRFAYFDVQRPFAQLLDELQTLAPTMIVAPPSVLRLLAAERLVGRLRVSPARIVAVAEVFDTDDRVAVEAAFGARAEEVYQASEGFLAATCAAGALHWNEDIVHVERDPLGSGRYYPVLTDFRRRLQPVVRYRLDDVLTDEPDDTPPCACGSVFRRIRRIEGRSDDGLRLPLADGAGTGVLFPDFVRLAVTVIAGGGLEDFRVRQVDLRMVEVSLRPGFPSSDARDKFLRALENALAVDCVRAGLLAPACHWMSWPEDFGDGHKRRRVVGLFTAT